MLKAFDHINIATDRLEETRRFYVEVLGFTIGPRPEVSVPGYWLRHAGQDLIHLMEVENGRGAGGAVDHFALSLEDYEGMRAHLGRLGIAYREFAMPDGSRKQMMIADPNGVTVELNWRAPAR